MGGSPGRRQVVIMGAAGRDFHNFNVVYRDNPEYLVVAFTAAQIPSIENRIYPSSLAGEHYPSGIPIIAEAQLEDFCRRQSVDQVVFAYSDVTHEYVMHRAARALAAGADFSLLGPRSTMIQSRLPVIAVSAVRTGCGKSQTSRWISRRLTDKGLRGAVLRHPMPYGDLALQGVQRFETVADMDRAECTIEEREEYEPHVAAGSVVFAGVDYARILDAAEREADVILWDGGNNDFPFIRPDLHIVLVDALRPEQATTHHPGEAALCMADVIVVSKVDSASDDQIHRTIEAAHEVNPDALLVQAASPVTLDDPECVRGKRVLVIEDGPTITHGGMATGAGFVAAQHAGAAEIIDPRPFADGDIAETYRKYPHIGPVLPAMGYGEIQMRELGETIDRSDADLIIIASPVDLKRIVAFSKPTVRAQYDFEEVGTPSLGGAIDTFLANLRREEL